VEARVQAFTLTDGGQPAERTANALADFIRAAQHTLEIAIYDVRLPDPLAQIIRGALDDARTRGVQLRLVYNLDCREGQTVPPPPETEPELVESLPFPTVGIPGVPDLMHHKYVIRDHQTVWTGSMNWTDDSWSRQENVIAIVHSAAIAKAFDLDFGQLWSTGDVARSGFVDPRWDDGVRVWMTPGHGEDLSSRIAKMIRRSRTRVRICSPVITTGPVLGTLAQVIADHSVDLAGCVDATQVREVVHQWRANRNVSWKLPLLQQVMAGPFTGKVSTPYGDGTVHDFMHAKVCVCDDTVFVGSFNLSRSGEKNAENVLEIEDAAIADRLASFVDLVRAKYQPVELPPA
jgi:phosphatidylserine/phosphatidylglycerophosphate/cardiolipin synthase-like enzyme